MRPECVLLHHCDIGVVRARREQGFDAAVPCDREHVVGLALRLCEVEQRLAPFRRHTGMAAVRRESARDPGRVPPRLEAGNLALKVRSRPRR